MASVRANCPDCGDVEFTTRDIVVGAGRQSYRFVCPGCGVTVVKAANERTIDLLLCSGAPLDVAGLSKIISEDRAQAHGPPLKETEITSFRSAMQQLDTEQLWAELAD